MTQYLVIGHDGKDSEALSRRMAARADHIALSDQAIKKGQQIMGVALLNDENQMCGSAMIVDFETRQELDAWLEKEPYVTGKVWQSIEVLPCKVGPSFVHMMQSAKDVA
jgi:uncharacterized protein YciI